MKHDAEVITEAQGKPVGSEVFIREDNPRAMAFSLAEAILQAMIIRAGGKPTRIEVVVRIEAEEQS